MIPIERKPGHQRGINRLAREKGHVSLDPTIKGIFVSEKCYKVMKRMDE
jgi:hypothetical protein